MSYDIIQESVNYNEKKEIMSKRIFYICLVSIGVLFRADGMQYSEESKSLEGIHDIRKSYITAEQNCHNHGCLTVKVEILEEPEELFREDGRFENIRLLGKKREGAHIDEIYTVNGVNITLRKTIEQNGHPWIHPDCYLVPALTEHVLDADIIIKKLLEGAEDEDIPWGKIGKAHLHHRVMSGTDEHH